MTVLSALPPASALPLLAQRVERSDLAALAQAREVEASFLKDHFAPLASTVGSELERLDEDDFYGELGGLLKRFVGMECADLDLGTQVTRQSTERRVS